MDARICAPAICPASLGPPICANCLAMWTARYELMDMAYPVHSARPKLKIAHGSSLRWRICSLSLDEPARRRSCCRQALAMFPGYHYALGNLAKVRI